jgi:hypothetical protein
MMPTYQLALPIMVHIFHLISANHAVLQAYLYPIFTVCGVVNPTRMLMSILIQPIIGIEYQQHYRDLFPELKQYYAPYFSLYGVDTIKALLHNITNSMAAWKVFLFQSRLLRTRAPQLLDPLEQRVLDVDVMTMRSTASTREGAEFGYNKKSKGKPCFQLSASFIGRVFVDAKLFWGHHNPKDFFRKTVKRAIALGLAIDMVRADSAYLTYKNLRLLESRSLGYAIGAPGTFTAVKDGKLLFKRLARQNSSRILPVAKGVSVVDLGYVQLPGNLQTRLVIVRRISRRKNKKTGTWKIRTYYYSIASNLDLSARKLYQFYHQRQRIESGFRELKQQYHIERLPVQNLKGNEFWIVCKILAMTLFKIFQLETLPEHLHSLQRKTLFRRIFQTGLRLHASGHVHIAPKSKYRWLLQRILSKTRRIQHALSP